MPPIDEFRQQLLKVERILGTDFSFDLAESAYVRCLELARDNPNNRAEFVRLLTTMFLDGLLSDEPIAFLMHKLRWPEGNGRIDNSPQWPTRWFMGGRSSKSSMPLRTTGRTGSSTRRSAVGR
jgi:hypothetical protein